MRNKVREYHWVNILIKLKFDVDFLIELSHIQQRSNLTTVLHKFSSNYKTQISIDRINEISIRDRANFQTLNRVGRFSLEKKFFHINFMFVHTHKVLQLSAMYFLWHHIVFVRLVLGCQKSSVCPGECESSIEFVTISPF